MYEVNFKVIKREIEMDLNYYMIIGLTKKKLKDIITKNYPSITLINVKDPDELINIIINHPSLKLYDIPRIDPLDHLSINNIIVGLTYWKIKNNISVDLIHMTKKELREFIIANEIHFIDTFKEALRDIKIQDYLSLMYKNIIIENPQIEYLVVKFFKDISTDRFNKVKLNKIVKTIFHTDRSYQEDPLKILNNVPENPFYMKEVQNFIDSQIQPKKKKFSKLLSIKN